MSRIIVYTNDNGTLSIISPNPSIESQTIIDKLPPSVTDATVLTYNDLPNEYYNSWELVSGEVVINLARAKIEHKSILQAQANELLIQLNEFMTKVVAANKDPSSVNARIDYLRTVHLNPLIDSAADLNALRAIQISSWTYPVIDDMDPTPVSDDPRIIIQNVINVKKNPGEGEFSSIKDAVDSITDSSSINRYTINVGPGTYTELPIDLPEYVNIVGISLYSVIVTPTNPNQYLFNMNTYSEISFMTLIGHEDSLTIGADYAAIKCENINFATLHKMSINGFDIGIYHHSSSIDAELYLEYIDIMGNYSYGIKNISENNFRCHLQLENVFLYETNSTTKIGLLNTGSAAEIEVFSSSFEGLNAITGSKGIVLENGSTCEIVSTYFKYLDIGLYSANVGSGQVISVTGTIFEECNLNFDIQHAGTTGNFVGYALKNQYHIVSGSTFYIGNEDSNIITVAKRGGNFTSIKDALDYITDSSETNTYTVVVGSGTYVEAEMTVPPYVSIKGTAINTTTIKPLVAEQHLFVMSYYCELSFMTLEGHNDSYNSGYSAVYIKDVGDFAQMHKVSIFGFDIGITNYATTNDCLSYIEYVDINESCTYDVKNLSENGYYAFIQLENYYSYESPLSSSKICLESEGTNAHVEIHVGGFVGYGASSKGVVLKNGGICNIAATFFKDMLGTAIIVENIGSGPQLQIASTTFKNCVYDFNIKNAGTTGYFLGYSHKDNYRILGASTFFVANQDARLVRVAKRGGDYNTITAAVNSITDSSFYNPYMVEVGPGLYIEQNIQLKSGIFLVGGVNGSVIIMPPNPSGTIIKGAEWSMVKDFVLSGAYGPGGTAVTHTGTTGDGFLVRDCAFTANETNVRLTGNTALSVCVVDRCITSGNVKYGFICSTTNGTVTRLTLQNLIYQDLIIPVCEYFASVSGINSSLISTSCMLNIVATSSATGFLISDGGMLRMSGTSMRGFGKGIHVTSQGSTPYFYSSGTLIHDSTDYDLLIEHPDTVGTFDGITEYNKTVIPRNAPFFVFGKDKNIITVFKKGGDFTSIKTAIESINDNSSTNRYQIQVGPGVFYEDEIVLKHYVNITGSGTSTRILPTTSTPHDIFSGSILSTISNFIVSGAQSGYSAFKITNIDEDSELRSITLRDITFGNNDTHVTVYSDIYPTYCNVYNSSCGGINSYNKGFVCSNTTNNVPAVINIKNFNQQNTTSPNPEKFVECSGTNSEIILNDINVKCTSIESGSIFTCVYNGGKVTLNGVNYSNFDIGIHSENNGNPPEINGLSIIGLNNTTEIKIDHTETTGSIIASVDSTKITNSSNSLTMFISDPNGKGLSFNGEFNYSNSTFNNIVDISDLIINTPTLGLIEGGDISFNTPGLVLNVTSGSGYTKYNDVLRHHVWNFTTISVTSNSDVYVYMNYNDIFSLNSTYPNTVENILLGRVISSTSTIDFVEKNQINSNHYNNELSLFLKDAIGPVYNSGSLISATTSRTLNITSGVYYFSNIKYTPSSQTTLVFDIYYRSSVSGEFNIIRNQTIVPNDKYDDGSGTLQNLTSSYYSKHTLLLSGSDNKYILVYGQFEDSSSSVAQNHALSEEPSFVKDSFVRICSLVVLENSNSITVIDERPRIGFASSSTVGNLTDHSSLTGLDNDDHPQYLLISGSRSMTGNLNLNSNDITNVSLINSIDIGNHSSRHTFNGDDALNPALDADITELSDSTSSSGVINDKIPRADHVHAHGNRGGGSLHAIVTTTTAGFMSSSDKIKLDSIESGATSVIITNTSPSNVTKSSASVGISSEVARADHKHDISTAAPSTTLTSGTTNSEGSSSSLARADHTHAISTAVSVTQLPDQTNYIGDSTSLARADHIHNIPSGTAVSLNANSVNSKGLASTFAISNHTHSIESGYPINQIIATTSAIGTSTAFARADHVHTFSTGNPVSISTSNSEGSSTSFARADHVHAHGNHTNGNLHAIATTSTAGFMSSSDKIKLNNISSEATKNDTFTVSMTDETTFNNTVTPTVLSGMALTPGSGNYLLYFNCGNSRSNTSSTVTFNVFINGNSLDISTRTLTMTSDSEIISIIVPITVSSSQQVDIRGLTSSGTITIGHRTLTLMRI